MSNDKVKELADYLILGRKWTVGLNAILSPNKQIRFNLNQYGFGSIGSFNNDVDSRMIITTYHLDNFIIQGNLIIFDEMVAVDLDKLENWKPFGR